MEGIYCLKLIYIYIQGQKKECHISSSSWAKCKLLMLTSFGYKYKIIVYVW